MTHTLRFAFAVMLVCEGCCIFQPDKCKDRPPSTVTDLWTRQDGGVAMACDGGDREPNDDTPTANTASPSPCAPAHVSGVLGGNDADFLRVRGTRCATSHPMLHRISPNTDIRMCLFVQCAKGSTGLCGCVKGRPMHLDNGLLGCCTDDGTYVQPQDAACLVDGGMGSKDDVELSMSCSNTMPNVEAYIVVDGALNQCLPYDLTYTL